MLAAASSFFDAVVYVVVGHARLAVELELVVRGAVRVVDCWLLRILCQQRAISRSHIKLTITGERFNR